MLTQAARNGAHLRKRILVIDVGGTHVKVYSTGRAKPLKLPSGPRLTPKALIAGVRSAVESRGWKFDAIGIGIPAPIARGKVLREPVNLGRGWTRFDLAAAAHKPVKVVNDAAMQALGSYRNGAMLFLGLGTGLGSALVVDGMLVPLELARMPYRRGEMEDYIGLRGLQKHGKRRWRRLVAEVVTVLRSVLVVDDVVLGGGNARLLKDLPKGCRLGSNALALQGGERLWSDDQRPPRTRVFTGAPPALGVRSEGPAATRARYEGHP